MRRTAFLTLLFLLTLATSGQDYQPPVKRGPVLPGKGHVDVELLNQKINLSQDVSKLNLCEVRVLRNAFYARKGYPFKDAFLRGLFQTTSWYDSLMWDFDSHEENFKQQEQSEETDWREDYYKSIDMGAMKITPAEQAFIQKLQAREKQLLQQNFTGSKVNMDNLYNHVQLKDFAPALYSRLSQKGFAIVPASHEQLFHVYESNDYSNFPSFITTDLFLQLYHLYFDNTLREVEEQRFDSLVCLLCTQLTATVGQVARTSADQEVKNAAEWLKAYLAVASSLQSGQLQTTGVSANYLDEVKDEVQKAEDSQNAFSPFLGYMDVMYAYSLYRPRGHYTRTKQLQRYFRTMMWLQSVPFGTDESDQFLRALVLAQAVGSVQKTEALYRQITEPLTYLMGQPDNVDILQVYGVMKQTGLSVEQLKKSPAQLQKVRKQVEEIAAQQTRIQPKFLRSSQYKINLMPQRYQPDAEVLQEMVDYDSKPTLRGTPKGLDVFAAMGVSEAERILLKELKEGQQWNKYTVNLEQMKKRMGEVNWQETVAKRWMKTLQTVSQKTAQMPYFMQTSDWDKKNLNAMLASWAELKHDAILYAKQPMGAECGGGGPPEPVVRGYVEPNDMFWRKALDLLKATTQTLSRYGLLTERAAEISERIGEQAEFLLTVSQKELEGKALTDMEYDHIAKMGSAFEYISIDLIREPDQYLMGWNDVEGPQRSVALVADVYTANADNNPRHCILYEAVGEADEIYVIVEIGGMLYLTRGAVFSYREFDRPTTMQRLTDEEWQEHLKTNPRDGVPSWMYDIMIPLKETPKPNEEYFYSTGC